MVSAGPQLPSPSVGKRKRDEESDATDYPSDTSTPSRVPSPTQDSSAKRLRAIGPTLPSARSDERPGSGPDRNSDTSSDDDDFGPSLPGAGIPTAGPDERSLQISAETGPQASSKNQRDEWMMVPPSNSDWSARLDPTKLKARRFNTGKSATTPSPSTTSGGDNKWTETPSEKRARLEREMMGITDGSAAKPKVPPQDSVQAAAASPKLRENKEKTRPSPLHNEHQKSNAREKEDDPSARPFDREKDIAGGMKISSSQRKEMMKRAADFGSRFSSAKYL